MIAGMRDVFSGDTVTVAGHNGALAITDELIASQSIAFTDLPTGNRVVSLDAGGSLLNIASSNAADAAAGTGARRLVVWGAGPLGEYQTEEIATNGVATVVSVLRYMALYGCAIIAVGSGGTNAGTIHVSLADADGSVNTAGALTNPGPCFILAPGVHFERHCVWVCPPGPGYEVLRGFVNGLLQPVIATVRIRSWATGLWYALPPIACGIGNAWASIPLNAVLAPRDILRIDGLSTTAAGRVTAGLLLGLSGQTVWPGALL